MRQTSNAGECGPITGNADPETYAVGAFECAPLSFEQRKRVMTLALSTSENLQAEMNSSEIEFFLTCLEMINKRYI